MSRNPQQLEMIPETRAGRTEFVFLAMVGLLPLHTVYFHRWISWKPWLVLLIVVAVLHGTEGLSHKKWPWDVPTTVAAAIFLLAAAASWSGDAPDRFLRLLLALGVGTLLLLVVAREAARPQMMERVLRTVFWSAAALAATALLLSLVAMGTFGATAAEWVNGLPLVDRVVKNAYLSSGFVAVTNWHQDPGYAAAWTNLWATLTALAILRGLGSRRTWVDALVLGGLWFAVVMTFSRTGILGTVVMIAVVLWRERERLAVATQLLARAALCTLLILGIVWVLDPADSGGDLDRAISFRLEQGFSLGGGPDDPGGDDTGALDARSVVWPQYVDAFREHPVRGIGLGTGWDDPGLQEPHNLLLELAGEMGILGLLGFGVLLATVVRRGHHPIGRSALTVALAAAITQTVLFEATWWFAAGLVLADPRGPPRSDAP